MKLPLFFLSITALNAALAPLPFSQECTEDQDLFRQEAQIFAGNAEFLYWTVAEGDLDYALKMTHSAWGPTPSYAQGRYESADFDLDPGVRVALHYFRAPHYWEVKWQYTRFTSVGRNESKKPDAETEFLTGTWPKAIPGALWKAKSHIHLNYNVFDWLIDRVFFPNPHLRLRFYGGASGVWMDQDWKVRYYNFLGQTSTIRNKWHFIGGGLKTGTVVDWYWTGELYMTGQAFFGGFIGQYSNRARQKTSVAAVLGDNPNIPIMDATFHDTRPSFTSQLIIGPSWQRNYPCHRLEIFAGFEMNLWANLHEIHRSTASNPMDSKEIKINASWMALYGFTSRITFDF